MMKGKSVIRKSLKCVQQNLKRPFFILSIIFVMSLTGYLFILYGGRFFVDEEKMILPAATIIETADGAEIYRLYEENRLPINIDQLPDYVLEAFVAIEDRRFYKHAGVDSKSVFRAIVKDIMAGSKVEGASTITQQVVKNLFLTHEKTWLRKMKEVMAAIYLERHYSKNDILELYINSIYYGHGVYGIEMAAQKYFSKSARNLTMTEAALLAGIVQSPNRYSPIHYPDKALKRRNAVLKAMDDSGFISTEDRVRESGKTLGLKNSEKMSRPYLASYIDLVTKEAADKHHLTINELKRGGYRLVVNMDEKIQKISYDHFKNDQYFPGNVSGVEGSFVMREVKSGKIVAAIGGRDYQFGHLNRVTIKRQPGSTIKPIAVYAPAMMTESFGPYSVIPDQKDLLDALKIRNSEEIYSGYVSLYSALMESKNTSAVWLLDQIGIDYSKEYLKQLNIPLPNDHGLSIALGGLKYGITPIQLMDAYATFPNEGKFQDSHVIDKIYKSNGELLYQANKKQVQVFTKQVAWNITEILSETVNQGTAKAGFYDHALAGKTGTTEHPHVTGKNKDIWFAGYTPEYALVAWIGYDKSDQAHYLTGGSSYPTILVKQILTEVNKLEPLAKTFEKPTGVEALERPIQLPVIHNLQADIEWKNFAINGKLTWDGSDDKRVVYRIYQVDSSGIDRRVGEVIGHHEYRIRLPSLFKAKTYYVVPYDPLTKLEGKRSPDVELSLSYDKLMTK
ncbi:penicillin-binding protein 1F [Cerasibacillus quisquiliarum]|uniref:Penicillin-binding protein 1F n=2 Tax=Cerasibacillus quisquiliarum TaxID=227865 RepID=A0A511UVW4_9BACI|nr:penicillin-binding protein 1F [Cerasibacillus quisquiliarum]